MFERFADEARRALTIAQEEARRLDHDFIGTEHLLLGLLGAGQGLAVDALTEVGVTLDEARVKVEERVHPTRAAASGTPPFTPLAKKTLERSLRAALTLNASFIGPEHMLLGLIDVPDGGGAQVLADLAMNLPAVHDAVLAQIAKSAPPTAKRETGTRRSRLWITRSGAGASSEAEPAAEPPRCPTCKGSMAEHARYRTLSIPAGTDQDPADDEPVTTDVRKFAFVYCDRCGTALGAL